MFLRKSFICLSLTASLLYAQTGIGFSNHGIRVPSAFTLQQGFVFFSGNFETVSDGNPLAMDGYKNTETGAKTDLTDQAASSGGSIQVGYGVFDFLELGLSLPLYYEGHVTGTSLDGIAMGDLQGRAKVNIPLGLPIYLSFEGSAYAPTGNEDLGFRPRHAWFLNEYGNSHAYTAGNFSVAGTAFLTFDFFGLLLWSNYGGYLTTLGDGADVVLWGSGFELFPDKMISIIAEISGEMRIGELNKFSTLWNEPARFTPGLRLHLPNRLDILVGADIGIDFLRGRKIKNGIKLSRKDKEQTIEYSVPSVPEIGFAFAITKTLDFSWKDSDRDGVADRLDMCPGSSFGVVVNNRGCPVDQDQDGVLNIVDDCPDTPFGIEVDFFGCPVDEDKDGVPDYRDKCPATGSGKAVNKDGCVKDSDNDGVDDNNDLCPDTSPEEQVNTSGCPIDDDHDGVLNEKDKCEGTPKGRSVDLEGCPLDYDHDGVPDELDKCPNSNVGEYVDENGCPADTDHDGVPDIKDQCADTPEGFSVDMTGCPSDHDNDSIPDDLDKCPNTVAGAPVDSIGCPVDTDEDGVADYLDKCPNTFPNVLVDGQGCPYNGKLNLAVIAKQIRFKGGSANMLNSSYPAINDVIELMRRYKFNLEVTCSASGANAQAVSEERAKAIGDVLKIKGFGPDKVKIEAVGAAAPAGVKLNAVDIQR